MKEYIMTCLAGWQSGYAAACKAVYAGSIPVPASSGLLAVGRRVRRATVIASRAIGAVG